jgi:hypothetical protein
MSQPYRTPTLEEYRESRRRRVAILNGLHRLAKQGRAPTYLRYPDGELVDARRFYGNLLLYTLLWCYQSWKQSPNAAERAAAVEAAGEIATFVTWKVQGKERAAINSALAERAILGNVSREQAKRDALTTAVALVLGEADKPRHYMIGRGVWLKDANGQKASFAPGDIPLRMFDLFCRWLHSQAIRAAEAILLDRPYPAGTEGEPLDELAPLIADRVPAPDDADPAYLIVERDQQAEDVARLAPVLDAATPRQRELLSLLEEGNSLADAARVMGIEPSTARVLLHKVRRTA